MNTVNSQRPVTDDNRVFRFAIASIVGMLILNVAGSFFIKGWWGAGINTALVSVIYFVYAARSGNAMLQNWLLLAMTAGFVELAADWWLVVQTRTLVYAPGPKVVVSPIYMPFAWMLVLVQVGLVGQWLRRKMPIVLAALATATLAGITIPLYESLAKFAQWWIYQDTPMILNAPYYIILGEFLLGLPLVWLGLRLGERFRPGLAVALGIVEGLIIWAAYYLAFSVVGQ